jgi:hypothetical protein
VDDLVGEGRRNRQVVCDSEPAVACARAMDAIDWNKRKVILLVVIAIIGILIGLLVRDKQDYDPT